MTSTTTSTLKAKTIKALSLAVVLLSAILLIEYTSETSEFSSLFHEDENSLRGAGPAEVEASLRRLLSAEVPIVTVESDAGVPVTGEVAEPMLDENDPNAYDILIVLYHKTGYEASRALAKLLVDDDTNTFGPFQRSPLHRRMHLLTTKCPRVQLNPGELNIQEAPDFFCDVGSLAEKLLKGSPSKRGIKIVHMIRNPFDLAISNYKYHSQDPTPEDWVNGFNVCEAEEDMEYVNSMEPTLLGSGVMKNGDMDKVLDTCHSLFRKQEGLEEGDYFQHLRGLSPSEGLILSASHQLRGKAADIARMANNIIKFRQLQNLERQLGQVFEQQTGRPAQKKIQVLTFEMKELQDEPHETARRFFDFLLPDPARRERNEELAEMYAKKFQKKINWSAKKPSSHITQGHGVDSGMLNEVLRGDELFGRVYGKIEKLVEEAVAANER